MTITPEMLRANTRACGMLWPFDFEVHDLPWDTPWFQTPPLEPFEVFGHKGSGCVYALTGPQRHVLFATSEGDAGIIAASMRECLELVVAFPYWEDILRETRGDLAALRLMFEDGTDELEAEALDYKPEIEGLRPLLRTELGLEVPRDPGGRLHHAVTTLSRDLVVRAPDGTRAAPLVGLYRA